MSRSNRSWIYLDIRRLVGVFVLREQVDGPNVSNLANIQDDPGGGVPIFGAARGGGVPVEAIFGIVLGGPGA